MLHAKYVCMGSYTNLRCWLQIWYHRAGMWAISHNSWMQHRLNRPFAYLSGWQFTGFTLTLLTLMATPTNGHAPYFLQPVYGHALFTRSLLFHWLKLSTHSIVIGGVLPPAGACCEFCFSFFFCFSAPCFTHTAERKGSQSKKKKNDLNPTTAEAAALATAVSLFYADLTIYKKRFLDIFFLNASTEI